MVIYWHEVWSSSSLEGVIICTCSPCCCVVGLDTRMSMYNIPKEIYIWERQAVSLINIVLAYLKSSTIYKHTMAVFGFLSQLSHYTLSKVIYSKTFIYKNGKMDTTICCLLWNCTIFINISKLPVLHKSNTWKAKDMEKELNLLSW